MNNKPSELPEGEDLAIVQFRLLSTTLILQKRTREAVLGCLEFKQAKRRLTDTVGQVRADEVEAELFTEEGSLLSIPPPSENEGS